MLLNAFRKFFNLSPNRKARRASALPRLELLSLEQRLVPATFTYTGTNLLTIDLNNVNEAITLTSSGGGNYIFTSTSNFSGSDETGLSGNGTTALTITNALALTDVAITDSMNGVKAFFGTSSGTYVDAFSITLNNTPGAIIVSQPTSFSSAAALTVNTSGSVSVAAGLSAGTGAISLTGTIGITLGANITSSGTLFLNSAVTLAAAVTLTGSTVTNSSTIAGNSHSLAIIGNAIVNGAISNIDIYSVSGTTQLGASVTSALPATANTVTATISVGNNPKGVAVNPSGTRAYVTNFNSNNVSVINTTTNTVAATISVGSGPYSVAVNPAGTFAFVTNFNSNNFSVIDTTTNAVTATVNVGNTPIGVAFNPAGTLAYVTNEGSNTVSVINTTTNAVTATINVGIHPRSVAVNPAGTFAYVTNANSNTVSVINTTTNAVTATINVGSTPIGVAVNPAGTLAYVTNAGSNTVSVINTTTNAVTATITVGIYPISVAVNPAGTFAYVTNQNSSTFSVINLLTVTGAQTYTGAVTLTADVTLTGSTVTNSSTIAGNSHSLAIIGNAVVNGAISGVTNFSSSGTTSLTADITTSGAQLYLGAVTLGANTTLNAGTGDINLNGTVSSSGVFSLTPITSSPGLTTISGANTNTTTNVTTGVVQINNSTPQTTNFVVSGGTLKGTGAIGNLTGTGTGIIAPGNSPGLVTTTSLNLSSGNTLQIEITGANLSPVAGTDYDQIVVGSGGTVNLNNATLTLSTTYTGIAGTVFTIVDNQGSNAVFGTFSGLVQGAVFTANGRAYQISYIGGTGNDVTLKVLFAPNNPTFGTTTSNDSGFTVQISNYDALFTYAGTATPSGAVVVISNTGLVTVSRVGVNTSSIATITTTRANYVSGSAQVTATSNIAPLVTSTPPLPSSSGSSTVTFYNPITGEETGTAVPFPGFNGPVKVVSGDWNNDGVADIIAGAGFGGGPAIAILDSQTGKVMESFFAFDPAFTGGVFVAVQDTNGDGIMDIIASAGPGGGPEVRIFDGNNLNVLRSFYAYAEDFSGGVSVASVDFNNDGILDLVTGAGPGGAPHVKVFDGATNAIISQWYAYPVSFTGGVFVAVGDIGNDGTFEVVTGAGQGGAPIVAVWDPFTGALLAQFMAYAEGFTGGVRVGINDGNSDGVPDILTGAGPGGAPQVNVFSFPALDILFQFYSGEETNPGGVFVS